MDNVAARRVFTLAAATRTELGRESRWAAPGVRTRVAQLRRIAVAAQVVTDFARCVEDRRN
ncbi:hypothetical protein [Nocardia sp. NPDC048505]|uniref:hypothetical protein n=1 Tax=unclassified Nocardia TaxID=2637762 RepID=UPI0033EBB22A